MKVNVTLQVEVDPAEWNATYGLGLGHREVAEDIREYVYDAACQLPGIDESGAKVALKGGRR